MIHIELPATMECVEPECGEKLGIKLALSGMGTLLPRLPQGHGWQLGQAQNGCFVCRCPKHHAVVETLPDAGKLVVGVRH